MRRARTQTSRRRRPKAILVVAAMVLGAVVPAVVGGVGSVAVAADTDDAPGSSGDPAPVPAAQPVPDLPELSDGFGPTASENTAMQAAARTAQRTGTAVAVTALTTETQQVLAQPTGGFVLTANTQPVRTRVHQRWVTVDTRLHATRGGDYTPAATAYGSVTLSGGGTGPLASTVSGKTRFAVSWPQRLPKPTISGSTATYPNVLPGVDLAATATISGGFSEVLIVKTAAAAANPALAKLRLAISGTTGKQLQAGLNGQVLTVADTRDGRVLQADTPRMWDSNTDARATDDDLNTTSTSPGTSPAKAAVANPATATVTPDRSDTTHPGLVAREKFIPTTLTAKTLTLVPDPTLLKNAATVFPVYIDPSFNWHDTDGNTASFDELKQGSPCNHVSLYNNDGASGDYGQLGVGVNAWDGCHGTMRAYYQWTLPHSIWGSQIHTATVKATEVYSASCSASATVNLHQTGGISSGTKWNNRPSTHSFTTSQSFPAAANSNCTSNGNDSEGFAVTSAIAKSASGHDSAFTVDLTEDGPEKSRSSTGFKRFSKNPSLSIQFDRTPKTPTATSLAANAKSLNVGCDTTAPYPFMGKSIASSTPILSATISDPDGDKLQASFRYWIDGSTTTATGLSGDGLASGSKAAFTLPSSFVASWTSGQTIDWKVDVTDGQATSAWSPTCHFTAEPSAPEAPTLTSVGGTNPNIDTDGVTAYGQASGLPGQFTITGSGTTATKFIYSLDIAPPDTSPTPAQTVTATNNAATVTVTPKIAGPHTLYVYAVDAAGDSSERTVYRFISTGYPSLQCASWTACLNNTAISPDATPSLGAADGTSSLSATDLTTAGWKSGGAITINGATFTLPVYGATNTDGTAKPDNILAADQTIPFAQPIPTAGTTAVTFLTFATHATWASPGAVDNDSAAPYIPTGTPTAGRYCFDTTGTNTADYCAPQGKITFADGSSQTFKLLSPDWTAGPASLAAVTLPHENRPTGQISTHQPKIYPISVPISQSENGQAITSITLPDTSLDSSTTAIHILGIATRNTTTTTSPVTAGQTWTGSWANPSEGEYNFQGANFSNQTFRVALKPSISGTAIRVKLDDALGTSPLNIGHATLALGTAQADGTPSVNPTGAVTNLTFAGKAAVSIPEGGMIYSDPLPYTVTANTYLLVSFSLTNSVPYLVQHSLANNAFQFLTAAGSGDHTADTTATAFTGTGTYSGWFTDVLTDVDVATTGIPTQAVLGDGLIDAWQPNTKPNGRTGVRVSDVLAAAEPTTPTPYGTIAEGIESNYLNTDNPQPHGTGTVGGPSALSRIDRDILDQPGLNTVVVYEGLEDVLNGAGSDDLEDNAYTELLTYLKASNLNIIIIGLPPCTGYTGDGATATTASPTITNDPCTADIDTTRTTINAWLDDDPVGLDAWTTPSMFYLDPDPAIGITDTTTGLTSLDPNAAIATDHINLTNPGYAALTNTYLGPQDTWQLDDGADATTDGDADAITTAADSAVNTDSPYLANNPLTGTETATLSPTGATWATDTTRGNVLALDGLTGTASTDTPALDTSTSYSLSAWAYLTDTTGNNVVISQRGTTTTAFTLQYDSTTKTWAFTTTTADATTATRLKATGTTAPTLNAWTHLVATYNATTHLMSLYVNGTLTGTATNPTPWNATGPVSIGYNGSASYYYTGKLSDIQAWNYTLTPTQVTALYQQIK